MPVTKPCVLWKDQGLLVRIISIKDALLDLKQVGFLSRFFKLKTSEGQKNYLKSLLGYSKSILRSPASTMF